LKCVFYPCNLLRGFFLHASTLRKIIIEDNSGQATSQSPDS
jgi:hypothetical protein